MTPRGDVTLRLKNSNHCKEWKYCRIFLCRNFILFFQGNTLQVVYYINDVNIINVCWTVTTRPTFAASSAEELPRSWTLLDIDVSVLVSWTPSSPDPCMRHEKQNVWGICRRRKCGSRPPTVTLFILLCLLNYSMGHSWSEKLHKIPQSFSPSVVEKYFLQKNCQ